MLKSFSMVCFATLMLTACGQKGDLYLSQEGKVSTLSPHNTAPKAMPDDTTEQPAINPNTQNPNILTNPVTNQEGDSHDY